MSVDNTTRPAMELNLDIAEMFYKIPLALYYDLDPLVKPSTPCPSPGPPGHALGPLSTPWTPCLRPGPPGCALGPLATPSASLVAPPWLHPRPWLRPGLPRPPVCALDPPMSSCTLSTPTRSPSQSSLPSTFRGLLQPQPCPLCGWPPNECLRDIGYSVLQLITLL